MSTEVLTVNLDLSALSAAKLMNEHRVSSLLVEEKKIPIGIVTKRDFLRKITALDKKPNSVKVSSIMSRPLLTINEDSSIPVAVKNMRESGVRRLAVFREEKVVGIITLTDISRYLL